MLVSFSIDPDALLCDGEDLSVSVAFHRRVIQEWRKHGVLIHAHGSLRGSITFKMIEELPQECRKLWKTAFSYNRRRPASVPWDGSFPNEVLADIVHLSDEFMLSLLESTRSIVVCGLGEHESSRKDPMLGGMELCKFHSVSESNCFQQADALSVRPLMTGDACGSEWSSRYSSHLKQTDHVAVVDRYILENHIWRMSNGDTSGLNRLLNDCFAKPRDRGVNIKLLCAIQNTSTPLTAGEQRKIQEFIHDLATRYSGGGIRRFECYVLADAEFAKHAHERYFRADYVVFGIDRGIDSYGGTTVSRDSLVWRHDMAASHLFTQKEAALQANALSMFQVI